MRNVAWLALGVTLAAGVPSCRAACTLRTQWQWIGTVRDPAHVAPSSIPVVVQLTDDDGNGRVDTGDTPDVAFIHVGLSWDGVLTALDGRDGSVHFTTAGPDLRATALAAGDLDGDGVVELVAIANDGLSLVAFHHDGSLAWQQPIAQASVYATIGIADLDQDGSPEIHFDGRAYTASGALRWEGTAGLGRTPAGISTSIAVELRSGAPGLELVAGNTCYSSWGSALWSRPDLPDGLVSVGDLDGDGSGEVLLRATSLASGLTEVHVLDAFGTSLGSPLPTPSGPPTAPTLVDLDGDGRLEVVLAMGWSLDAFTWTGSQLVRRWSVPMNTGCCSGATGFDIDGDGSVEIFFEADGGFFVIDGLGGSIVTQNPVLSWTALEDAVVADIDADGVPEVLALSGDLGSTGFVTAYECGTPVPTRCIWNQNNYHVTNVHDDGTIPRVEVAPWAAGFGHLQQEARSCCGSVAPTTLPDVVTCAGVSTTLDASSLADPGCAGGNAWEWRDELGVVIGSSASLVVTPSTTTTYSVSVDCPSQPACARDATLRVVAELSPLFTTLRARDPDACNLGLELTWDAATFRDPSGTGVYDVFRSETSCLDALAQPPVATGLTALRFVDVATRAGQSYHYVVQAEDARLMTPCPRGPHHGGAVNAGLVCFGPVLESPDAYTPDILGWALRAGHVGDVVTMAWPGSRALLPGEHFHVLKSYDEVGFARVNLEGDLSTTWIERDTSRPLQFFDVRIATPCEIQSLDDEPPGRDPP